jgi:hypothetical protein
MRRKRVSTERACPAAKAVVELVGLAAAVSVIDEAEGVGRGGGCDCDWCLTNCINCSVTRETHAAAAYVRTCGQCGRGGAG